MKKYKGYYIDNITFKNESEIDAFLKKQEIECHVHLSKMFSKHSTFELSNKMSESVDRLHILFGLSYEDIEDIENAAMV